MDSQDIIYTGIRLDNISVDPNTDLQTILGLIDTAIVNNTTAPDFTSWNLYCVKQIDGTSHPTTIEDFSKGISKMLCDHFTTYATFVGTTYPTDQTAITNAISALQVPGLTYARFSITNTDTITQVFNKSFTGFTAMANNADPSGANWSSISVSPAPTTVEDAFNATIAYGVDLATALEAKEDSIGTFDNSENCLSGGSTDKVKTTIDSLTNYVCALPAYDSNSVTWGCVTQGGDLQTDIENMVHTLSSILNNYLIDVDGTSISKTTIGSCLGKRVSINTAWSGLYKVMTDVDDTAPGFLSDKLVSNDDSINFILPITPGDAISIQVATPVDHKVKINSSDSKADYLSNKVPSVVGNWGLSINSTSSIDNTQLILTPNVYNPDVFVTNFINTIASDPDLLSMFCALKDACLGCLCGVINDLVVAKSGSFMDLTWTAVGGSTTSQIAKYRPANTTDWFITNFTPANPLGPTDAASEARGLTRNYTFDFQVDSNCPGDVGHGNIFQMINYLQEDLSSVVVGGVISVNQNPMPSVEIIDYRLLNVSNVVIQSLSTTGLLPNKSFTSVSSGVYSIQYRYGTTVNGALLYSDNASQAGAWYAYGPITV